MNTVWIFHGVGAQFASGALSSIERAEEWIAAHGLSGLLTRYPLDEGSYDSAIANGTFRPKRDDQKSPNFIQRFTDGTHHHHFENGVKVC
jgi:hypothetical protein